MIGTAPLGIPSPSFVLASATCSVITKKVRAPSLSMFKTSARLSGNNVKLTYCREHARLNDKHYPTQSTRLACVNSLRPRADGAMWFWAANHHQPF